LPKSRFKSGPHLRNAQLIQQGKEAEYHSLSYGVIAWRQDIRAGDLNAAPKTSTLLVQFKVHTFRIYFPSVETSDSFSKPSLWPAVE
jgi:hypothetical protein